MLWVALMIHSTHVSPNTFSKRTLQLTTYERTTQCKSDLLKVLSSCEYGRFLLKLTFGQLVKSQSIFLIIDELLANVWPFPGLIWVCCYSILKMLLFKSCQLGSPFHPMCKSNPSNTVNFFLNLRDITALSCGNIVHFQKYYLEGEKLKRNFWK